MGDGGGGGVGGEDGQGRGQQQGEAGQGEAHGDERTSGENPSPSTGLRPFDAYSVMVRTMALAGGSVTTAWPAWTATALSRLSWGFQVPLADTIVPA